MKIFKISLLLVIALSIFSCDNEIDLNAEFVDTPVVFGLLNAGSDTQLVRITRGFLKDGESAIDLAQDVNNLYYDSLKVQLTHIQNGTIFPLTKMLIPKEPGVFNNQDNRVYMLENSLAVGNKYKLEVIKPDGTQASAETRTLGFVKLDKPDPARPTLEVSFVNNNLQYLNYDFQFNIGKTIAKFEAYLYFYYDEIIGGQKVRKQVKMPIGTFTNSDLAKLDEIEISFPGLRFFQTIANEVNPTATKKELPNTENLMIEIFAGDETLVFYQDLNGPIEGLAQVRPEFTNVENGVGLFASRSVVRFKTQLNQDSKLELINGAFTGNHNFSFP